MASDYKLLRMKIAHENVLKHHKSLDDRMRAVEEYKGAAHRNNLENQKRALEGELSKMAPAVRAYYLERIEELSSQITKNKEKSLTSRAYMIRIVGY